MRLTPKEHKAIKECVAKFFPKAKVYLFGSRVDDRVKGGDIDLYIKTSCKVNDIIVKIKIKRCIQKIIGEQKIDIIFAKGLPIEKIAMESGVLL